MILLISGIKEWEIEISSYYQYTKIRTKFSDKAWKLPLVYHFASVQLLNELTEEKNNECTQIYDDSNVKIQKILLQG